MSRYIDADALADYMNKQYEELYKKYGAFDHFNMGYSEAISAVENAPTEEVDTVVFTKKITREQEISLKGTEFKEHIKKQMVVELAHYLLEKGYIHFTEDRDRDIITILGLLKVLNKGKKWTEKGEKKMQFNKNQNKISLHTY